MSTEIDLTAVQSEVDGLSIEALKEKLTTIRVRQKVQQKKQQGKGSQKAYQAKQNELRKLLKAKAIELGIYDEINDAADALAEEKLAEEVADANDE